MLVGLVQLTSDILLDAYCRVPGKETFESEYFRLLLFVHVRSTPLFDRVHGDCCVLFKRLEYYIFGKLFPQGMPP